MNQTIRDLELIELIGEGRYGSVYRAARAEFGECAVRLFRAAAVNRRVLAFALEKAITIPPHPGLVRVYGLELGDVPGHCVTELFGEAGGEGKWQVTTLEDRQGKLDEKDGWNLLYEVACALDHLHKFGIAHCDVGSRNVIFHRDQGTVGVKVTGFGMGRMADVQDLDLGVEALRLAPEQLKRPRGIYEGAAFGWDVYSFGVLAYRALTGRYPRGEEFWRSAEGERGKGGSVGSDDVSPLVAALFAEPEIRWPKAPPDEGMRRCRELAEQCLRLDPSKRPVDLREVREEFDRVRYGLEMATLKAEAEKAQRVLSEAQGEIVRVRMETTELARQKDSDVNAAEARAKSEALHEIEKARAATLAEAKVSEKKLRDDVESAVSAARNQAAQLVAEAREQAAKKVRWVKWGAVAALIAASALFGLSLKFRKDALRSGVATSGTEGELREQLATLEGELSEVKEQRDGASAARVEAEKRAATANERYVTADNESQTLLSRLIHFGAGVQGLAEDQVRETLAEFEAKLEDPSLVEDELSHARTLHDVAVMRRRLGDDAGALEAFIKAGETFFSWLNGAVDHPGRVAVLRRLAHCEEASYQLFAAAGRNDDAIESLQKCTGVYDSLLDDRPDDGALIRRSGELHFVLGQYLRMQGRDDEALDAQGRVVDALAGLDKLDDPTTVMAGRYLKARSRYETGLIERQKGDAGRAIDAQIDATEQLVSLAAENPDVMEYRFSLALCYTELGELVSRHRNFNDAKEGHNEAVRILVEIVQADLRNDQARLYLARNYGELGMIDRDEGDLADGFKKVDGAVQILAEMVARVPGTREYAYRLAIYETVRAEILTEQKKGEESVQTAERALASLEGLVEGLPATAPVESKLYRIGLARAYEGLGFASAGTDDKEGAKENFTKAVGLWTELAEAYAGDTLIADSLEKSQRELKQFGE